MGWGITMKYRKKFYLGVLSSVARFYLNSLVSFQFTMGVIFTALFCTRMLGWIGISQNIQDLIFIPCATYFIWAMLISFVDMKIERDVL